MSRGLGKALPEVVTWRGPADGRTGAGAIFLPAQVEAFPPVCAGPKKDGAYGSKTPRRTWLSCLPASTAGESGSASSFFEEIP